MEYEDIIAALMKAYMQPRKTEADEMQQPPIAPVSNVTRPVYQQSSGGGGGGGIFDIFDGLF
jgi:hypothetical protein